MSEIKYLRTGTGTSIENANLTESYKEAVLQGYYVGFYHELREEKAAGQVRNFLHQLMGRRCDARPALEVSRVTSVQLVQEALVLLRHWCQVAPVLYAREPLSLDYGCPVWLDGRLNDVQEFLLMDREKLIPAEVFLDIKIFKGY